MIVSSVRQFVANPDKAALDNVLVQSYRPSPKASQHRSANTGRATSFCRMPVSGFHEMGVDVERGCRVRMSETTAHGSDRHACGEELGGLQVS